MREVWSLPPEDGLHNAGPEWLLVVMDSGSTEEVANLDMVLLRAWSVRNKVTQGGLKKAGVRKQPEEERASVKGVVGGRQRERQEAHCFPLDHDGIKNNVDRAFNLVTSADVVGVIARDNDGNDGQPHIMVWRVVSRCRDAEEAEALALLEGAKIVEHWSANICVEFESDCANLVQMVADPSMDRSAILAVIIDIKEILARRPLSLVWKIWREQNRITHNLANYALKSRMCKVSFSFVPLCIQDLVLNDRYRCWSPVSIA
jgi:hypothetical protein